MIYSHIFASCPQLSIKDLWAIKRHFRGFERAYHSISHTKWAQLAWPAKKLTQLSTFIAHFNAKKSLLYLQKHEIDFIPYEDARYPEQLKQIYLPPIGLYVRGNQQLLSEKQPMLAVVGPRKASHYGLSVTELFCQVFVDHHIIIVSGLAKGIDGSAHKQAVQKNFPTIAVLAGSLEKIYPAQHTALSKKIIENGGLLISESGPGKPIREYSFILRNRIISGLSQAVFLVEAGKKSGGLITARAAFDQNRLVFTVPQSLFEENSYGSNQLIIDNIAQAIQNPQPILDVFGIQMKTENAQDHSASPAEKTILKILENSEKDIYEIHQESPYSVQDISIMLSMLEVKGIVKKRGNKYSKTTKLHYQQLLL